ncbi:MULTISPECIES: DUF4435 domain-containing protein [unclassified Clostridium]|uniref:DUF4435 domain-containing protein n=1 Tax=unclassified Clostridium TaxID=2614128 RepID=UPI0025C51B92|nr:MULTISPECIES: DUF4435 domain-containing protein [unclassified Clostridium]
MNMLEKHQVAIKGINIPYHRFLLAYKSHEDQAFIFCEGNEDLSYYSGHVKSKLPSTCSLYRFFVDGRNKVLRLHDDFDWNRFCNKQILFFIDRDVTYWCEEKQTVADNIYITDGYSFENEAVNDSVFIECLEDLFGFANATEIEINKIRKFFIDRLSIFNENMRFIMACVVVSLKKTNKHLAKEIKPKRFIDLSKDNIVIDEYSDISTKNYIMSKLELTDDDMPQISYFIDRFVTESEHYYVRGKWALYFMIECCQYVFKHGREFAPSLYDNNGKEPKRLCDLNYNSAMSILAPRLPETASLRSFLLRTCKVYGECKDRRKCDRQSISSCGNRTMVLAN